MNDGGDADDLVPGDGYCDTDGNGTCTLRAAIEETNTGFAEVDAIIINVPLVTLTSALPALEVPMNITGFSGPDQTTVQRSTDSGTPDFSIFVSNPGSAFSNMTITNAGGEVLQAAIDTSGSSVTNCKIVNNGWAGIQSSFGDAPISVSNCVISGNLRSGILGAGTWNVTGCTISGNGRGIEEDGDGIYTVSDSTISDNTNGGIFSAGASLTLSNSAVSNNSAHDGAGIWCYSGTAVITNSTIAGNFTTDPASGVGAGILLDTVGYTDNVFINNCTITKNIATTGGGGIWSEQPENGSNKVQVKNTIIAQNAGATIPDVAGPFESQGFNLIGNTDGGTGFDLPTDHTGTGGAPWTPG